MEKPLFDAEAYRDGVAEDLKDLRQKDRDVASQYLEAISKTNRYDIAKEQIQSQRRELFKLDNKTTPPQETVPESAPESKEKLFSHAVEVVKANPDIFFFISGAGNVLNESDARTDGVNVFCFDHTQQKLVRNMGQVPRGISDKMVNGEKPYTYYTAQYNIGDKLYYIVRMPFKGYRGNRFVEDNREGVHMTTGIGIPKDKTIEELFGKETQEFFKDKDSFLFELAVNHCAKEFAPDYYDFINLSFRKYKQS